MKTLTLEETVQWMERCISEGADWNEDFWSNYVDALHYLREYREKHDEILRMEEALGYCEIMANPPLTWDELRTMEGKPVWIKVNGYNGYWTIVHWNSNIVFEEFYDWIASPDDFMEAPLVSLDDTNFGKTWQAYRKER